MRQFRGAYSSCSYFMICSICDRLHEEGLQLLDAWKYLLIHHLCIPPQLQQKQYRYCVIFVHIDVMFVHIDVIFVHVDAVEVSVDNQLW